MSDKPIPMGAAIACCALAFATGALAVAQAAASPRRATVLHLFAKEQTFAMFNANGRPLSPAAAPTRGDYLIGTDIDYLGNHSRHASTPAGSDNAVCTFTSPIKAVCDEVIAMGGSLLLSDHVTVNFSRPSPVSRITGGTGRFTGARGAITVTPLSPTLNSDLSVRYSIHR